MADSKRDVTRAVAAPGQLPQFVPRYVDRLLICCYNYPPTIELIVPLIWRIHSRTSTYRDVKFLCSCQETFVVIFLLQQKVTNVILRCYNVNHLSPLQRAHKKLSYSMPRFTSKNSFKAFDRKAVDNEINDRSRRHSNKNFIIRLFKTITLERGWSRIFIKISRE